MFLGESVNFSCHINVSSGWNYEWYKDDTFLSESSNIYSKSAVEITDDGQYKCRAKRSNNQPFVTDFSQDIDLEVQGKFLFL